MAGHDRDAPTAQAVGQAASWRAYAASAIGADHVRAGRPNEDAAATQQVAAPAGSCVVLAVADGHGHARHFRSDRGSRLAVAAALEAGRDLAAGLPADVPPSSDLASGLAADVVARWRAAVAADLAGDPVSGADAGLIGPDDPPEIPYGSTLLIAILTPAIAVLAQIGDGDMFLVRPDGRLMTPVPSDLRLDGTQTTSMCQADAVSAFRVAVVSLADKPSYAVFAATDGYGNAQAREEWRAVWSADLVGLGMRHDAEWIGSQLPDWAAICASSDGSSDDTTVALAINAAAALTRPAMVPHAEPARPLGDEERTLRLPGVSTQVTHVPDTAVGYLPSGSDSRTVADDRTAIAPAGVPPVPRAPDLAGGPDALAGRTAVARPQGPPLAPAASPTLPPPPPGGLPGGSRAGLRAAGPGRRWLWLVVAVIVVGGVVAWLLLRPSGQPARHKVVPTVTPSLAHSPGPTTSGGTGKSRPSSGHHKRKSPGASSLSQSSPSPSATR